jgi:NAD(P)-dependent dehydrogenase (short-subunit alcohol dehydrogenase family)
MKDTLAVVTGSGSGMGRAIALEFANEGRSVAVLDRNMAGAEETVALIKKAGGEATAFEVDISSEESVLATRDKVEAKYAML